jgi:uncharacterized protein YbbC (DUF1343 family)
MRTITSLLLLFLVLIAGACQSSVADGPTPFRTGAEVVAADNFAIFHGKRVGLITNHTAVVGDAHLADLLHSAEGVTLSALFGPEHGIRGDAPAGDRIQDDLDERTGVTVYSLYGDIRKPTPEMLQNVDVLVFDIQDVGARFYTYISTMVHGMEAAAENGIPFVVLDRPNPLGGELIEGFVLEPGHESFVGIFPMPVTHGLTVGELANMAVGEAMVPGLENLELTVVQMEGWSRNQYWTDISPDWLPPSPNIPDFATALIYPGACFFEGTTASEGRGTYEPFMVVGAPWADGEAIAAELNQRELPGLRFEAVDFTPVSIENMATRPKWRDQPISGVRHVITDQRAVRPVEAGVHLLDVFYRQAPEEEKATFFTPERIQRLAGGSKLHTMIEQGVAADEIVASWQDEIAAFDAMRQNYFLYE